MSDIAKDALLSHPFTEVLCQLNFDTPPGWNGTAYGVLLDSIRDLGFTRAEDVTVPSPIPVVGTCMVRYRQSGGPLLLQLGPSLFSVHSLIPYSGWSVFKVNVLKAIERFQKAVAPVVVNQLTVRYINRFGFPVPNVDIESWFTFRPTLPALDGATPGAFIMRQQWNFADGHLLIGSLGVGQPIGQTDDKEKLAILLEFEYTMPASIDWTFACLADDIESAHSRIRATYTRFLTEPALRLLDEVKHNDIR